MGRFPTRIAARVAKLRIAVVEQETEKFTAEYAKVSRRDAESTQWSTASPSRPPRLSVLNFLLLAAAKFFLDGVQARENLTQLRTI